ncbi:acetoacetyl-CoA synthase [Purpureocillium lavendulum]|uniref:Acetoacetyl-CoA synthase n=1 Tax=Purpureocillium lavendulum TaxID=1247861 RepID=A0AB34FVV1_9HYPO|nr:acetoacetyl-CoA synthase [Purpureocillium lavendulum]
MATSSSQGTRMSRAQVEAGVRFYTEVPTGSEYMVHICRLNLKSGTTQQFEDIVAEGKAKAGVSCIVVTANDPMTDTVPFQMANGTTRLMTQPARDVLGRSVAVGLPMTQAEKSLELLNCLLDMGYRPEVRTLGSNRWSFWERGRRRRHRDREQ